MSVVVQLPGYATPVTKQARLTAPGVGTVVLPWWPDEVAHSALAPVYQSQDRPGRAPLLLRSGDSLPEVRLGCVVSTANLAAEPHVGTVLEMLQLIAIAKRPVTLQLASRSSPYRVTDLGITELDWNGEGQPTSAEVSVTLTSASDAVVPVGPIPGKPKR